ncbi:hypothetical protein OROGR_008739 [Orobanche gracilis]
MFPVKMIMGSRKKKTTDLIKPTNLEMGSSNPSLASSLEVSIPYDVIKMVFPKLYSQALPHFFQDDPEFMALESFQGKLVYLCKELQNQRVFNIINATEITKLADFVQSLEAMVVPYMANTNKETQEMKTETEALKDNLKNQGEETIRALRNESKLACRSMKEYVDRITATTIQNLNEESAQRIKKLKKKKMTFLSKQKKNQNSIEKFIDDKVLAIGETTNQFVKTLLLEKKNGN